MLNIFCVGATRIHLYSEEYRRKCGLPKMVLDTFAIRLTLINELSTVEHSFDIRLEIVPWPGSMAEGVAG